MLSVPFHTILSSSEDYSFIYNSYKTLGRPYCFKGLKDYWNFGYTQENMTFSFKKIKFCWTDKQVPIFLYIFPPHVSQVYQQLIIHINENFHFDSFLYVNILI